MTPKTGRGIRDCMILHAHIYYSQAERTLAHELREMAFRMLGSRVLTVSHLIDHRHGPHPMPTFEMHFDESMRKEVVEFFEANRADLSVLIHQDTGDDHRDHSENIVWLGNPVALDFGFFELIKKHPELRINPESK